MIDVDIAGQLFPNPLTMVVQLCSTLLLFFLMKRFLWASVKQFMSQRAEKMQSDLTAGEQAKQEALSDRKQASQQLALASEKSEEIVKAAVKQAKEEKEIILAQAKKEAAATYKKAQEQIEAERVEMYRSMQKEMVDIAMTAASKLIGEKSDEALDRQAIDAFVKDAQAHGE